MTLRFLCFNIHGGRSLDGKHDLKRVNALLDAFNIDIGVFQEMETRPSQNAALENIERLAGADRRHYAAGPSILEENGWYGNLIISRYPILRTIVHNLETKPDLEPRNAIDTLIQAPFGIVRVVGTHLSLSIFERWSEARNLLRLIHSVEEDNRYPLFLMGDINEWQIPSKLLRYLNNEMFPVPAKPTFPSFFPIFRLDRAWHDDQVKGVVKATTLSGKNIRKLSDHLPLLIEASFTNSIL